MTAAEMAIILRARDESGAAFSQLQGRLKKTTGRVSSFTTKSRASFDRLGKGLATFARRGAIALTALAAGGTLALYKLGQETLAFQDQMARVSTMLDDVHAPMMRIYKRDIAAMAMQFGQSTEVLSQGAYDILSAMVAPENAMKVLTAGAEAATAGFTDTSVTISAFLTILKSFGKDAKEVGKVSDKVFTIIKRGRTTFAEMGPVLGRLTGMVAASGGSFDEMSAAIATTTRNGLMTNYAITDLIGVYRTFLRPSKEAQEAADKLGISLNAEWLATHSLREALQKVHQSRTVQLKDIFTESEALTAASFLMKDLAGFTEDYRVISTQSFGATSEASKKMQATTSFQLKRLKEGFKAAGRSLLDNLLLNMRSLLDETNEKMPVIVKQVGEFGKKLADLALPAMTHLLEKLDAMEPGQVAAGVNDMAVQFMILGRYLERAATFALMLEMGMTKVYRWALAEKGHKKLLESSKESIAMLDEWGEHMDWLAEPMKRMYERDVKRAKSRINEVQEIDNLLGFQQRLMDSTVNFDRILKENIDTMQRRSKELRNQGQALRDNAEAGAKSREELQAMLAEAKPATWREALTEVGGFTGQELWGIQARRPELTPLKAEWEKAQKTYWEMAIALQGNSELNREMLSSITSKVTEMVKRLNEVSAELGKVKMTMDDAALVGVE